MKKIFSFPQSFKEWNGFVTAEGQYIDNDEFHALVIGIGTGYIGGINHFAAIYGLVTGGKKLTGHLKDVKKEFAYTFGGFLAAEGVQYSIPHMVRLLGW